MLFLAQDGFLLVWDRVTHRKSRRVDVFFHIDSTEVEISDGTVYAQNEVSLAVRASDSLTPGIEPGEISETMDRSRPSSRIRLTDEGSSCAEFAAVLVPYRGSRPVISPVRLSPCGGAAFSVNGTEYRFAWDVLRDEVRMERARNDEAKTKETW